MIGFGMAALFKVPRSPFWQLRYKLPNGKWGKQSTKFRHALPLETRQARALEAEHTQRELQGFKGAGEDRWDRWVVAHLRQRYATRHKTRERYEGSWRMIQAFMELEKLELPKQVTRSHVKRFIEWRQNPQEYGGKVEGIYPCSRNTALGDTKVWRIIMAEAVHLGYTATNPCASLGIPKDVPKEKRPFTDAEIVQIRKALLEYPEWMSIIFEIALHQALRLRQCRFPMSAIDWKRGAHGVITYPRAIVKGKTAFSHPVDARLVPLLRRLQADGREWTCEDFDAPRKAGEKMTLPSKAWFHFFRKLKMKGVSFHCCRVTWITRACLADVPVAKAMRFCNHGSTEVHRIYQKLGAEDIMTVPAMVAFPDSAADQ